MKTIKQIWKEVNVYTGQEIEENAGEDRMAKRNKAYELEKARKHEYEMKYGRKKDKRGIGEDAPANAAGGGAIAGLGVDHPDYAGSGEPGVDPKKKKRKVPLIDGRTKAYRQHRERLEAMRAKRAQ